MEVTFRPLDSWPGQPTKRRERSQFSANWSQTLELLQRELRQLGARAVVVKLALRDRDLRQDGWPRRDALAPEHPGVIVEFQSKKHGWLSYHADKFTTWQDNFRAIARSLEALRSVERWGAVTGEQYVGSQAELEGGSGEPGSDLAGALKFLRKAADITPDEAEVIGFESQYRMAAKRLHPDQGGNAEQFQILQRVRQTIEERFGWE